jgi:8-hydroxy-5-deazaflavin:NADPH oxidoreductase
MVATATNEPGGCPDGTEEHAMKIAIIGAGNVGTALATSLGRAGHEVIITDRDRGEAEQAASATGARVADSNAQAAAEADVVIPAVGMNAIEVVAEDIAEPAAGKPVVDVTNRISFGETGPDIDTTSSNAEEIAELLPKSPVVKAFNTLFASNQADPIAEGVQLDGYVAGDDPSAKAKVLELVRTIGLRPIDVGPLVRARQLEGLAFLNMTLNIVHEGSWDSGWKLVGAPAGSSVSGGQR